MTARSAIGNVGVAALAGVLLAAAMSIQAARERAYPVSEADEDALYVTSPPALKRLAGPYTGVAADAYWIRALQYYGRAKQQLAATVALPAPPPMLAAVDPPEYRLLYPLLDITTTLDPWFSIAYRFGAVFLAEPFPAGAGRSDLAVALLEKGIRQQPDKWEYMEDVGFVHYWYDHDFPRAAAAFERAARVPGAPNWLKPLAATTLAQGGDRRTSRAMWEEIRQSTDVDWLRQQAEHRLRQFTALDQLDAIQATLDRLTVLWGMPPGDWDALVRAKVYPGVPLDPTDTPYEIMPEGRVRLSPASPLNPLPSEPARVPAS